MGAVEHESNFHPASKYFGGFTDKPMAIFERKCNINAGPIFQSEVNQSEVHTPSVCATNIFERYSDV